MLEVVEEQSGDDGGGRAAAWATCEAQPTMILPHWAVEAIACLLGVWMAGRGVAQSRGVPGGPRITLPFYGNYEKSGGSKINQRSIIQFQKRK